MNQSLLFSSVTHAHIKPVLHPRLGAEINGRTAVCYLRFLRQVKLDRLELPRHVYGRWVPNVPVHPAHVTVSRFDAATAGWEVVRDVELPPDPRIAGKGLSQSMSIDEMNVHFQKVLTDPVVPSIKLRGVETDLLRVECDREHPVWPNHGETQGALYQVPFGVFNTLKAFGKAVGKEPGRKPHLPILTAGRVEPRAPRGMTCRRIGESVRFESRFLSVGFALRRPLLLHLGWDAWGEGQAGANRLAVRRPTRTDANHASSGPLLVTGEGNYGAHFWTGTVEVKGNRVAYRRIHALPGVCLDIVFHVEPKRLLVEMVQETENDVPVLESEAWRLVWCLARGMTGVAADPTLLPGRSGDVKWPALIAGDGVGGLGCRLVEGDPEQVHLQVESYRSSNEVTSGIVLGRRPAGDQCQRVRAESIRAAVEFALDSLQPVRPARARKPGPGVRRHWTSVFSCYRPEWAGFSNHAASVNCHVNQSVPIDVAVLTGKARNGFDPLTAARFTIARALMEGGGYGYWRNLYMDADPVLVCGAGRIFQVAADPNWLRLVEPGLVQATDRILGTIGKEGLAVCNDLSGNSGSYRWSSNAFDIVGFGHLDGYVNAWTYRALRNAIVLMRVLGRVDLSTRARLAAVRLRKNYARHLVNPKTGWVAGWRSRDGQLHDYAMLWVNGPACAFGVLEPSVARRALHNLERLRDKLGLRSSKLGQPFGLLPLDPVDHIMPRFPGFTWTEPTFELFTDGSMSPCAVMYYLRALSIHGFRDRARTMAADLDAGFADGLFTGGAGKSMGEGNEFLSWEGLASGYEGTFGPTLATLYGVAIEQGALAPLDPEWWPTDR